MLRTQHANHMQISVLEAFGTRAGKSLTTLRVRTGGKVGVCQRSGPKPGSRSTSRLLADERLVERHPVRGCPLPAKVHHSLLFLTRTSSCEWTVGL